MSPTNATSRRFPIVAGVLLPTMLGGFRRPVSAFEERITIAADARNFLPSDDGRNLVGSQGGSLRSRSRKRNG